MPQRYYNADFTQQQLLKGTVYMVTMAASFSACSNLIGWQGKRERERERMRETRDQKLL